MSAEKSKAAGSKIDEIQDKLDAAEAASSNKRRERRYPYRRSNVIATIEHPGGGVARIVAQLRSIWCEGITFLCAGFSYPGSSFTVTLVTKDGEQFAAQGSVVACRYVEGVYHEIEVKFRQRIDPHLFIEVARNAAGETTSNVELSNLQGKVLHLDDSEADAKLLAHHLRTSSIELKSVRTGDEALAALRGGTFDIFLADLNLGGGRDSIPVVKAARAEGFSGPIVVLSAENDPAKLSSVKAAGIDYVLAKPYQRTALMQMMVRLHQQVGAITSGEVLYSTLSDQPDTEELITTYVKSVKDLAEQVLKAVIAGDMPRVREYCLNLRGSAPGYGFPSLGLSAEEALRALDSTMSLEEARPQLRTLALLCGQLGLRRTSSIDKPEPARAA